MTAATRPLAVVTGASSGIGYELARLFAGDGHDLCLAADEDLDAAVGRIRAEHPDATVHGHRVDLATAAGVDELAAAVPTEGELQALVLNAGVGVGGRFVDTDLDDELRLIAVNVVSTVRLAKRLVPVLVARGRGRVLVTSSVDAQMADPYEAVYGASKAFGKTFAESLASELSSTGVTVTAFMPGPTETNFFRRAGMMDTLAGRVPKDDPAKVARQAYSAMTSGRRVVTTGGVITHVSNLSNKYLPSAVKGAAHALLSRPGSAGSSSSR